MVLKDIRGFMVKKLPLKTKDEEKIHIKVENWQWESTSSRFTWKHGVALALLIAIAILFAFGFLIIAGVILIAVIILKVFSSLFKKLS